MRELIVGVIASLIAAVIGYLFPIIRKRTAEKFSKFVAKEIQNSISPINDKITALENGKSRFDEYLAKVNDVTVKNNSPQTEITTLEEKVAAFAKEKSKVDEEIAGCVASIKKTTEDNAALEKKVSANNENVVRRFKELESSLKDVSAENAKLQKRIAELEKALRNPGAPSNSEASLKNWDIAEAGDRQVLIINGVEFAFRYCPADRSAVEKGRSDDETQRPLAISEGFWICETPTTQEQWDATGVQKSYECFFKGKKLPVENVSWYECFEFVQKLNDDNKAPDGWRFDLPYEEEWEYACRAGTTGEDYGVTLYAWCCENSDGKTHEVGTKKPNHWKINDMLGNVWEWTRSKGGSTFVERGGSWYYSAQLCSPAIRDYNTPSHRSDHLGFRCILVRSQSK